MDAYPLEDAGRGERPLAARPPAPDGDPPSPLQLPPPAVVVRSPPMPSLPLPLPLPLARPYVEAAGAGRFQKAVSSTLALTDPVPAAV